MSPFYTFTAAESCPSLKVERPNPQYAAEMLSNIGSCRSEMSTISLYLYNNIILTDTNLEIAKIFHSISVVEMHHWQIFAQLARMLGADPRLWSFEKNKLVYWSPGCNQYPRELKSILENSLQGELAAISHYSQQAERIGDCYVTDMINRIILDEKVHAEIFREMLAQAE